MYESWYLFPGQTLENSIPSARGKALLVSQSEWSKINSYINEKEIAKEISDKHEERKQYLKDTSYNMTKDWDYSIEKIHQRQYEAPYKRKRERETYLVRRYKELMQEQAEERKQISANAYKMLYAKSETPVALNSALLVSEVLYERKIQQDFDAAEREYERKVEEKYAKQIKFNAEQEKLEKAEEKRKKREKIKKYYLELTAQKQETINKEQKEREDLIKSELQDIKKAIEENKAIEECEIELVRKQKASVKKQFLDFYEQMKQRKQQQRDQEAREDRIVQIYAKSKCRIDEMKKNKLQELEREKERIRDMISQKAMATAKTLGDEQTRILDKAFREREEKIEAKLKADEAYQQRLREEQAAYRRDFAKRKQQAEEECLELKKWKMANRFKGNEVIHEYNQDKKQRLFDEKLKYSKELTKQLAEDTKAEELRNYNEAVAQFYVNKNKNDDAAFFTYADEVLDLARSRGRTLEPILKVIEKYKAVNLPTKKRIIERSK